MVTSILGKNIIKYLDIFYEKISTASDFGSYLVSNFRFWSKITSKMRDKFWRKWQLWPKNVITQILQRLYYLIFTLVVSVGCIQTIVLRRLFDVKPTSSKLSARAWDDSWVDRCLLIGWAPQHDLQQQLILFNCFNKK